MGNQFSLGRTDFLKVLQSCQHSWHGISEYSFCAETGTWQYRGSICYSIQQHYLSHILSLSSFHSHLERSCYWTDNSDCRWLSDSLALWKKGKNGYICTRRLWQLFPCWTAGGEMVGLQWLISARLWSQDVKLYMLLSWAGEDIP